MSAYNYYSGGYPNYYNAPSWQPVQQGFVSGAPSAPPLQYMIQVDGEIGAKAWQPQGALAPNTVIPLWDFDGQHVYFKSTDAYGRMNPVRRGRVVFDDEAQPLPQGTSGAVQPASQNAPAAETPHEEYVPREDFDALKGDVSQILKMLQDQQAQKNPQPGSNNQNGRGNRG